MRINRFIAATGAISRRKADELVRAGRVRINGTRALLGDIVDPEEDEISLEGRILSRQTTCVLVMYKPKNMLTTLSDPQGRPCISDLIPKQYRGVFPVGRLDFDAECLLILTNDGDLAHALHHPSYRVPKTYLVKVTPSATRDAMERMERGVVLDGKKTLPAKIVFAHESSEGSTLRITLIQGLKNQIKRMAVAVGLRVVSIKRISVGPLVLKGLSPGDIRELNPAEVSLLHKIRKKQ